MSHPADRIIEKALQSSDRHVIEHLRVLCLDSEGQGSASAVLRCLGRQPSPGTSSWRTRLVRDGLAKDDVEIRDAAAQAAESWPNREMRDILSSHLEPESWLRDYIEDIICEMRE